MPRCSPTRSSIVGVREYPRSLRLTPILCLRCRPHCRDHRHAWTETVEAGLIGGEKNLDRKSLGNLGEVPGGVFLRRDRFYRESPWVEGLTKPCDLWRN